MVSHIFCPSETNSFYDQRTMNETHMAVFCCLDNSYSLRRFLRIVFVFSWVNFLSKHTLCVPHVGSKLKKKKSYNSFAVNKMMTDLGCFVITEGHVSCSAVIITNYSIQLFSGFCEFALFFVFTQRNVGQQKWPHWEFKDVPILCTIMHLPVRWALDSKGFFIMVENQQKYVARMMSF